MAFDGAQTLDISGPAEVFAGAARLVPGAYEVSLASASGGPIETTCGFEVSTRALARVRLRAGDTVLVSGGDDRAVRDAMADRALVRWVARAAARVGRIGSVCSGAFVLARAGVLDGKRASTHWSACAALAKRFPHVTVDADAIFVRDGRVWTSAGVTTGIDMALAMVEEDHGATVADRVASRLVLYARRPGFQSQFAGPLVAQAESGDPFGAFLVRARGQLRTLDVPRLAKLAGVSVRTLHRRCAEQLGVTPRRLVERLRVEHARTLLSTTSRAAKSIAHESGFASADRMRRAFVRELGMRPAQVRLLFGARTAA